MRMKFWLPALLFLLIPCKLKGDEFNFSFTPNQDLCASYGSTCGMSGSGIFTTDPIAYTPLYYHTYPVIAIAGTMDGSPMNIFIQSYAGSILGAGTSIWYNSGPINFTANGQEWGLLRTDQGPWRDFLYNYETNSAEPINLAITTPEPSILVLMSIGFLGICLVLAATKKS